MVLLAQHAPKSCIISVHGKSLEGPDVVGQPWDILSRESVIILTGYEADIVCVRDRFCYFLRIPHMIVIRA